MGPPDVEKVVQSSGSDDGRFLSFFIRLRCFFPRSRFSFSRLGTRVRMRGRLRRFRASNRRRRRMSAAFRFWYWLRCSRASTLIPEGRCMSRTPLSVRF